jgi:hypothetical protein
MPRSNFRPYSISAIPFSDSLRIKTYHFYLTTHYSKLITISPFPLSVFYYFSGITEVF